jgi:hypothetical protein
MKFLIVSLIAAGALCAAAPDAAASSHDKSRWSETAAQQGAEVGSRHRHWRRAHYHRVVVAPRRYRYVYGPAYPRPYYSYRVHRPYYYRPYVWGPGPFVGYAGYRPYGGPWSGYMMGLGYGW